MAKRAQIDAVRPVLDVLDKEVTAVEKVLDSIEAGADKATDVVEAGLDKVADVVPEVLDKGVHISAETTRKGVQALRNPRTVAVIVIAASMAAGAGLGVLGYKLLKKRLEKQFEERLEKDLDEMRIYYKRRNKEGEFATPASAAEVLLVEEAVEALEVYTGETAVVPQESKDESAEDDSPKGLMRPAGKVDYTRPMSDSAAGQAIREQVVTVEEKPGPQARNIFVDGQPLVDDDWDIAAEEANRNQAVPYVISHDEFMENAFEHPQVKYVYYAGDDILANENEEMVHDIESVVGSENLGRFGHGSRDRRIVYVRNERLEQDIEVVHSDEKYSQTVMNLRHSDESPGLRRARWGDNE